MPGLAPLHEVEYRPVRRHAAVEYLHGVIVEHFGELIRMDRHVGVGDDAHAAVLAYLPEDASGIGLPLRYVVRNQRRVVDGDHMPPFGGDFLAAYREEIVTALGKPHRMVVYRVVVGQCGDLQALGAAGIGHIFGRLRAIAHRRVHVQISAPPTTGRHIHQPLQLQTELLPILRLCLGDAPLGAACCQHMQLALGHLHPEAAVRRGEGDL